MNVFALANSRPVGYKIIFNSWINLDDIPSLASYIHVDNPYILERFGSFSNRKNVSPKKKEKDYCALF